MGCIIKGFEGEEEAVRVNLNLNSAAVVGCVK
jgi:hypothetical protein